jgi:hypothetical protein
MMRQTLKSCKVWPIKSQSVQMYANVQRESRNIRFSEFAAPKELKRRSEFKKEKKDGLPPQAFCRAFDRERKGAGNDTRVLTTASPHFTGPDIFRGISFAFKPSVNSAHCCGTCR